MAITPDLLDSALQKWIEVDDEEKWDEVAKIFQPEVDRLHAAGLNAEVTINRGDPTDEIVRAAESWSADCIFLGPKGARGISVCCSAACRRPFPRVRTARLKSLEVGKTHGFHGCRIFFRND